MGEVTETSPLSVKGTRHYGGTIEEYRDHLGFGQIGTGIFVLVCVAIVVLVGLLALKKLRQAKRKGLFGDTT